MTQSTIMPRIGQAISGATLLAIAIAAGVTGLTINVHHGLDLRLEAGILFGLADLTKIVLPIVCGIIGWSLQSRIVAAVCIGTSIFCALNAFNGAADQKLSEKGHLAAQYAQAKADVATQVARVASLDAQVAQEAKNKGCGNACKALKEQASTARLELSSAKATLKTSAPVEVSATDQLNSRITAILFLVLIEALVWMSVPAMQMLAQACRKPVKVVIRKKRAARKPVRKTEKQIAKLRQFTEAPKLTKSGKIDGRSRQARAVKKVVGTRVMA